MNHEAERSLMDLNQNIMEDRYKVTITYLGEEEKEENIYFSCVDYFNVCNTFKLFASNYRIKEMKIKEIY